MAKLIITEDGRDKIYEIVDEVFTIGAGADADLQLRDDDASDLHVEVRKTPQGFRLIDLETKGGTVVNGQPINQHVLGNGDTIEIGETRITYIGRGPAQRGGGRGKKKAKKTNLQSTSRGHYRRSGAGSGISGAAMGGIAVAGIGVLGLIIWALLNSAGAKEPTERIELRNALNKLEQDRSEEAEKAARETLDKYTARYRKLSEDDREVYAKLKKALADHRELEESATKTATERPRWARIKNFRQRRPNDHQGLIDLCKAYLADFDESSKNYAQAQAFLKRAEQKLANVSPEDRELAELEGKVAELVWQVKTRRNKTTGELLTFRRYREAYKLVQNASPALKAVREDELAKMALKLRQHSRRNLSVSKDEVRHALRENDPAKANRMLDMIFEHLIHATIEAYLENPDGGYRNPETARLELETQKLLRERLARHK